MLLIFKFLNIYGFGCNIKGLITILQIKKKLKFDLIVDLSNHVFCDYLAYKTPDIKPDLIRNYIFTYYDWDHRINFLTEHLTELFKHNDIITLFTNASPNIDDIDDDIKNYIKNLLELELDIQKYYEEKLVELPKSYKLYHYRLGDNILLNKNIKFKCDIKNTKLLLESKDVDVDFYMKDLDINKKIDTKILLKNLNTEIDKNIFIISDSQQFKLDIFNELTDIYISFTDPTHTSSNYKDVDTLIDFLLVKNATFIKCFTSYSWISNFVLWTSIVYDIPLENNFI